MSYFFCHFDRIFKYIYYIYKLSFSCGIAEGIFLNLQVLMVKYFA